MKRALFGVLVLSMMASLMMAGLMMTGAAQAGEANAVFYDSKGNVVPDPMRDPMRNYYGNTYTCYWPRLWECHHWWNEDGTEVFFSVVWAPEGLVTLRTVDGLHDTFVANNQWCSHNARNVVTENGKAGLALDRPDPAILNNNENRCSPIVDAQPGDHWYKLHLNGHLQDQREQYTLQPGHQ